MAKLEVKKSPKPKVKTPSKTPTKTTTKTPTKASTKKSPQKKSAKKSKDSKELKGTKLPYLDEDDIKGGVRALKKYIKAKNTNVTEKGKAKDLLEAGNTTKTHPIIVEVVFKNIPSNTKTYIHNIVLPHHWRKTLAPEDYNMALFVKHRQPENEAQKIQFSRDRELDIDNTHTYFKELFEAKLTEENRARISRIITSKELATEYNTHQKIDRLAKTYDLFLGDKKLVANKFNALLRRLGRRFWVRERKVPMSLKLEAPNLNERFEKVMSTEPFYIIGNSSTERIQIGLSNQKLDELVENIKTFLERLYKLYGDNVRFIRMRTNKGLALPLFADLATECPKEVKMQKKSMKRKAVEDDFDMLPNCKIRVNAGGTVKLIKKVDADHVH